MESIPLVSVIVPCYHDWTRLSHCIESLKNQTLPKNDFEIIIVNNDPNDRIPDNFFLPTNAMILTEEKPGSYAARNKAIRNAKGNLFAFTDADCQPQVDWLECAIRCLEENSEYDRVGGNVRMIIAPGQKLTISEIYEKAFAFRQQDFVADQGMAATANMIAKKNVFEKVGLFEEELMSGGDADWGIRANFHGSKILYCDKCVVWHPTRRRISDLIQKSKREAGGNFLLEKKCFGHKKIIFIVLGFFPPVRSFKKIVFDANLSIYEISIAFLVRYLLRIIFHFEKLKLFAINKSVERV